MFCNADVILTKNSILQKTVSLLAGVQEHLLQEGQQQHLPSSPKISRGENYRGLPYVVLDYPRIASGNDLFFIRSLFWWGHFFSSTLQLAGHYKEIHLERLAASHAALAEKGYSVGIGSDPWQHHFTPLNYQKIAVLSPAAFYEVLQQAPHIKIAASWPLSEWERAAMYLTASWKFLYRLIA